jgi:hypothetical protein
MPANACQISFPGVCKIKKASLTLIINQMEWIKVNFKIIHPGFRHVL